MLVTLSQAAFPSIESARTRFRQIAVRTSDGTEVRCFAETALWILEALLASDVEIARVRWWTGQLIDEGVHPDAAPRKSAHSPIDIAPLTPNLDALATGRPLATLVVDRHTGVKVPMRIRT